MKWNWQQKDWPNFSYQQTKLQKFEENFLYNSGIIFGAYKHLNDEEKETLKIELIASEALKTSEIEGEILNRDSLQSSIRRNFGLACDYRKIPPAEKGISDMMSDLYKNFDKTLTHETLFKWHEMITSGRRDLQNIGSYRTHDEPMQIISGRLDEPKIHFEAPPSKLVNKEMDRFIIWFNESSKAGKNNLPAIIKAAIAHHYFVSIHPFEDGNGRIARSLAIKSLSESIKKPILTSFSTVIQDKKKDYYNILERSNQNNEITKWIEYFAKTLLKSQEYTQKLIDFLIAKAKLYEMLKGKLNQRQEKVLQRIFKEGLNGFQGGLSAQNYISITKTTKPTATRDLNDLVDKRAFIKTGKLKGSRYHINLLIK